MKSHDSKQHTDRRRPWCQFRLATLFFAVTVAALAFGWIEMKRREARRQEAAVRALKERGAEIIYSERARTLLKFLIDWIGRDAYYIRSVRFSRDRDEIRRLSEQIRD